MVEWIRRSRRHQLVFALGVAAVVAIIATVAVRLGGARTAVDRTIELPMKNFEFAKGNPTLRLRPGETVRIVVRNDEPDPRVIHSFRIPGLKDATCKVPIKPGEQREFIVRVPRRGEFVYTCCTHPGMGGSIAIDPAPGQGTTPATK
jgi:plastocyanin